MANGMGSLFVGSTGLRSAQNALNTTAHNLANINTVGYTRQQVSFSDTQYMDVNTKSTTSVGTYGLGVAVSEIRRIRDQFIDSAYRAENSRLGYYESQYKAIEEVEDQFGEMQGVTYETYLINFYDSINELTKNPSSTVARSSLIQNATAFLDRSQSIYNGLKDYQTTLNTEIKNKVDRINELGNKIYDLNKKIAKIEAAGVEDANDYRDQRDSALDELSGYIEIDYYESESKEVIVTAENVPFVTLANVTSMSTRYIQGTSLVIPTWPAFDRDVYKSGDDYSAVSDNDKGELKGLLLARGNMVVDKSYVPVVPDSTKYDLNTPEGIAEYESDYEKYKEAQEFYDRNVGSSVILTAFAGFDYLVNGIVEAINNVLCPEKTVETTAAWTADDGSELQADIYTYNASANSILYTRFGEAVQGKDNGDGTYSYESGEKLFTDSQGLNAENVDKYSYVILDMDKTDYGMDDDKTVGTELFSRKGTERYIKTTINGEITYVRNNLNETGLESAYSLGNLEINPDASQDVAKLPLSTIHGKEDFAKAEEMLDLWEEKFGTLNPAQYAKSDYMTYYNNFVSQFATWGDVLSNYVGNQQTMVDGYDNQRLQTEGVSSDEELEKMIKYQQAYNASSRYINVISEMLETLITNLGAS
ncbi:MAG: flagellar hook-associated protein FlgK [Lachnospira sp.]